MLIEIHMLKNYPPVNLNRDDTGVPKTCLFGGTTRGRISSQCLKRSWRTSELFKEETINVPQSIRTRQMPDVICSRLEKDGIDKKLVEAVRFALAQLGKSEKNKKDDQGTGDKKKDFKTKQVIPFSDNELDEIYGFCLEQLSSCKTEKEAKSIDFGKLNMKTENQPIPLDLALFGRMATMDSIRNVEASMQVAHAISTNKVALESDYFTAVDDLLSGNSMDEMGAGMISDVDYNASCYYHYASLDADALAENLSYSENPEEIVKLVVPALLRAMAFTNPSGKQNSFAGHILPSAMLVQCKEKKVPVSLVNAYAEAVKPGGDMAEKSIRKLAEEADLMQRNFGLPVKESIWFCVDKYDCRPESATKVCESFPELVESVAACLN